MTFHRSTLTIVSAPCPLARGVCVKLRQKPLRRNRAIGVADDRADHGPVNRHVEPDPQPPPVPDIGWDEERGRPRANEDLQRPHWSGAPEREAVIVMVIGVHDEGLLALHEPRRLAMAQALRRFGERQTEPPEPRERVRRHRAIVPAGACRGPAGVAKLQHLPLTRWRLRALA